MAGKISKDKKKYIIAGISGILVIILILTAYSINSAKNDKKPTTDVSVEDSDKKVKSQSSASSDGGRVASTVEIEFEDSAVLVGTSFKVTAIVNHQIQIKHYFGAVVMILFFQLMKMEL